jgi:hypothetical protein
MKGAVASADDELLPVCFNITILNRLCLLVNLSSRKNGKFKFISLNYKKSKMVCFKFTHTPCCIRIFQIISIEYFILCSFWCLFANLLTNKLHGAESFLRI